jgi:hypothetical protein
MTIHPEPEHPIQVSIETPNNIMAILVRKDFVSWLQIQYLDGVQIIYMGTRVYL